MKDRTTEMTRSAAIVGREPLAAGARRTGLTGRSHR